MQAIVTMGAAMPTKATGIMATSMEVLMKVIAATGAATKATILVIVATATATAALQMAELQMAKPTKIDKSSLVATSTEVQMINIYLVTPCTYSREHPNIISQGGTKNTF